jgi:hypothetical protein
MGAACYVDAGRRARKKYDTAAATASRTMLIIGGVCSSIAQRLCVPGIPASASVRRYSQVR